MVKLLCATGPLFAKRLDWVMSVVADAGYDGVEVMVTQDAVTQDAQRVAEFSSREGVPAPVVHGPFLLLTRRVFGTDLVQKAMRSLELASEIGAGLMVVHPPYRWQSTFHRWLLDEADDRAAELDTKVGVENLFPVPIAGRRVRFHKYTEITHLQPFRHLVLDTSHFGVTGVDLLEAWAQLAAQTTHLHVSDNRGHGRDSHAPLGHGILPLASFLQTVGASGYSGYITLELDCRRYQDDRAALVGYLRQEREKTVALLDGAPAEEVLGRPDRAPVTAAASEGPGPTEPGGGMPLSA